MQPTHTIATSKPPPRATPSIAATDGFRASGSKYLEIKICPLVDKLYLGQERHKLPSTMSVKKSTDRDQGLSFSGAYKNLAVEVRNARTYSDHLVLTWLIFESIYVKSCTKPPFGSCTLCKTSEIAR
jgi:hypothetical protein